jgi:hypothetical protein
MVFARINLQNFEMTMFLNERNDIQRDQKTLNNKLVIDSFLKTCILELNIH